MNVSRTVGRLATAGVATALAAGALVGASSTAANAAFEATSTYTCNVAGNDVPMPMTVSVPILPPTANAGTTIPGNLLDVSTALTIPAAVASQLGTLGVNGGKVDNFAMLVGDQGTAPAPLTVTGFAPGTDAGSLVATATGKNALFTLPKAGTYDISLPKSFTFVPSTAAGPLPFSVPCTTDAPAKLSSVTLAKNGSVTDATGKSKVAKGKSAKVTSVVSSINDGTPAPSGKIVAKMGKKTVGTGKLNDAGKAVMKLAKMPVGKHKITVKYLGDDYTDASQDVLNIKVVK
jgi:hypothetical protein